MEKSAESLRIPISVTVKIKFRRVKYTNKKNEDKKEGEENPKDILSEHDTQTRE